MRLAGTLRTAAALGFAAWAGLGLGLGLELGFGSRSQADEPKLSEYYGFLPVEIYKLDRRIDNLRIADLDGDKAGDILIANNGRSRIDLLLTTKGKDTRETRFANPKPNEVPDDKRMRLVSLPTNKAVVSVQIADFNGDGRPDIAYYGTPAEIVILTNEGDGKFTESRKIEVADAVESLSALTSGDLNGDGKMDLALMRLNEVVVIRQADDGKFEDPIKLPHTATSPGILKICDLDGDGVNDIAVLGQDREAPIRARLSTKSRELGPEQRFAVDRVRALDFADVDGKPGDELLMVEARTGRLQVMSLRSGTLEEAKGRLILYPLPEGNARDRALDLGDLDGDGKIDVVVSDPANTQLIVYLQTSAAGLGVGAPYPSLIGVKSVRCADLDGDKKAETVVLSSREKQLGIAKWSDGRLTFPTPLPIVGDPSLFAIADLDGDKAPEVVYLTKDEGKSSLRALKRGKGGDWSSFRWGDQDAVAIKPASTPEEVRILDVDRDGQNDFLLLADGETPTLLLGRANSAPVVVTASMGPLSSATPEGVSQAVISGDVPSLLVTQETVARDIVLDKNHKWIIKDQFNAGRANAKLAGVQVVDVEGDGHREVVFFDSAAKKLFLLSNRNKDKVYRNVGSIDVGAIDLTAIRTADLNGDGSDDLLLAGTDKFAVLLTGKSGLSFQLIDSFESNRKDARFGDVAAGDLNGDGITDLVVSDVAEHFIEIVAFDRKSDLLPGLAFRVFEKRSFRDVDSNIEPREFAVGDVDGDQRQDLVVLTHDRLLVYRQDSGEK